MRYQVIGPDGFGIDVDAVDWMMAMCEAIRVQQIEVSSWACWPAPGGGVLVTDPQSGRTWSVAAAEITAESRAATPAPRSPYTDPDGAEATFAPDWEHPDHHTFYADDGEPVSRDAPSRLAERLFDLSAEIAGAAEPSSACHKALEVALSVVPCAAGSVLRGTLNDDALTFVAASGPAAKRLLGRKVPFGKGLVGAAYDQGVTIQVRDASSDHRHLAQFDRETGFETRAVVCVPVRAGDAFFGVIQLINPPGGFEPWHVEAVESVAGSLATTLASLGA